MNNDIEKELKELQIQYDKVLKERNELEKENKILKKDLERLEKLEKIIETLKKSFLLSVGELHGIYYVLAYDNNYVMTKEEYSLLKEVLEDEN